MIRIVVLITAVLLLYSCKEKYDYYAHVQEEMESGVRNDSLFLGYYLGMSQQDFYDHSWELNKQRKVKQGQFNRSVEYQITDQEERIQMNFFPTFENGAIANMPVVFTYTAWAPWNKELWSDKLILHVRDILEDWHNIKFELVRDKNGTPCFVNVSGNRRIIINLQDDQKVNTVYSDMVTFDNPLDSLVVNKKYEQ